MDLTANECNAIGALKQAAKHWPKTLWLFAADGRLCVMRKDKDGKRLITKEGGMDQSAIIEHINIESDGGDWD